MTKAIEAALEHVRSVLATKHPLDRLDVRPLLLALGRELLDIKEEASPWTERVQAVVAPHPERWAQATQSELALACAEHVHAVDPRYLDLPNYDFLYTYQARDRLEERLAAARGLGIEVPQALWTQVKRADGLLEAYPRPPEKLQGSSEAPEP